MKKFLLLAVMAIAGLSANAQLVRGTTFVKKESNTTWFLRAGMSMNNAAGKATEMYNAGTKIGYDVSTGFQKPIANSNMYWGMEFGLGTRGAKGHYDDYGARSDMSLLAHNVKISPVTFGYKFNLTDNLKLDGHLGAFVSYDYIGTGKEDYTDSDISESESSSIYDLESYNGFDAGLQVGVGVWFNRFNLDFTYQRGFMNVSDDDDLVDDNDNQLKVFSSNFMIRLGVAF